ncbi:hypothetical protein KJ742_02425, partial [Patescibacteria group bacterium]|nr:hypothetical protein [Patescibacteria group bacterium]
LLSIIADKKNSFNEIDFDDEAKKLINKFNLDFEEYQCIIPIIGLSVSTTLAIGDVNLCNIEDAKEIIPGNDYSFFDNLLSHKDSVSITHVRAEWRKATDIARNKTDRVLNILRLLGSLVWYNQPARHINLKGKDQSRFSYSLVLDKKGRLSRGVNEEFFILPYKIDAEFLTYASFYGFEYYKGLVENRKLNPLENSMLIAIQWFGDSIQDLNDLNSFLKSYICIEILLKKIKENGKNVIPRRLSTLMYPYDKTNQRKLEKELIDIIDERNSVFHSGVPIKEKPEYLRYVGRVFGRSVIHQVRLKIMSENISTKEALVDSIKKHYKKFLE